MNITKADIVDKISTNVGISKNEAKSVLEEVLTVVVDSLSSGKKIELRGFGVFNTKYRPARTARNPKTGESIELGEKYVPMFKPSLDFTTTVNKKLKNKSALASLKNLKLQK